MAGAGSACGASGMSGDRAVMDVLREATWDLHQQAERSAFQQALLAGRVDRSTYAAWLGQMLLVHEALERHLRHLRGQMPETAAVVAEYQFQEGYLRGDLEYLGVAERPEPLPATQAFTAYIERLAREQPVALLGVHYVLEGSNNGSRFLARSISAALGLTDGQGTQFLDPYGAAQRERWQAFREGMNGLRLAPDQREAMVEAAKQTFLAVMRLGEELSAVLPAGGA